MGMEIERIGDVRFDLGEGPLWHPGEKALYGVNIHGSTLWRLDPETQDLRTWQTPSGVGSFAFRKNGGLVLAMDRGFHFMDLDTGKIEEIASPAQDEDGTLFNDGTVDQKGRFLAGTRDADLTRETGSLYELRPDLSWEKLDSGIVCSNGPCWSPDGGTFYFADSLRYVIYAYDYDLGSGKVKNRRVLADIKALGGAPDGATVDAEGYVWSAICMGGVIARFAPDGRLDRKIEMPTSMVCSCIFGGDDLDVLYATSIGMSIMDTKPDAEAGGVFAIRGLGVKGVPEPFFAG
jgi:sugar lactone lactonase YvrE